MIEHKNSTFLLSNKLASLALFVNESGHLMIPYYGGKIEGGIDAFPPALPPMPGFGSSVSYEDGDYCLDHEPVAVATLGKGDFHEPSLRLEGEKGSVYDFRYESYSLTAPDSSSSGLPEPHGAKDSLSLVLSDQAMGVRLTLAFTVYDFAFGERVIVENLSKKPLILKKVSSFLIPFLAGEGFLLATHYGSWANEFHREVAPVEHGKTVLSSHLGASSNRENPFFFLKRKDASYEAGECFGFNLVYSGSFEASVELTAFGDLRVQEGIQPTGFDLPLAPGEKFFSPVGVLTYSSQGINGLTHVSQRFVEDCILPLNFARTERPVDYNSWEGSGVNVNEKVIGELMEQAAPLGVELFVIDDGWFLNRSDDARALGDWIPDPAKFPHGLKPLGEKCHKLGMKFGVWFEPEMISPHSKLYEAHPDWAVRDGVHKPSLGRHQLTLDLTKKEVRDYVVDSVSAEIEESGLDFIKWDYNRNFSDFPNVPAFNYRYIVGLYEVLRRLRERYPDVMILDCASGGDRVDLGMFCYCPLCWASDNTDGFFRAHLQEAMIVGYPQSVMGSHVASALSMHSLRLRDVSTNFDEAAIGVMGYEMDLRALSSGDLEEIKAEISFYKEHRRLFQFGEYSQISSLLEGEEGIRQVKLGDEAILCRSIPEQEFSAPKAHLMRTLGLEEDAVYSYGVRPEKIDVTKASAAAFYAHQGGHKATRDLLKKVHDECAMPIESFQGEASGSALNHGALFFPYASYRSLMLERSARLYFFKKK